MTDQHKDQQRDMASPPVSLVIPCRPEYVGLCRLVAGALGLRDSLPEEAVADIKVIVTEACNCFLAAAGVGGSCGHAGGAPATGEELGGEGLASSIRMDFLSRSDAFVITVLYPVGRKLLAWLERCDPMSEAGLGLTILKALADEMVEVDAGVDGTALRLTKWLSA